MVFYEKNSNELTVTAKKEEFQGKGLSEPTTMLQKLYQKMSWHVIAEDKQQVLMKQQESSLRIYFRLTLAAHTPHGNTCTETIRLNCRLYSVHYGGNRLTLAAHTPHGNTCTETIRLNNLL